jgi:hypothetical protein
MKTRRGISQVWGKKWGSKIRYAKLRAPAYPTINGKRHVWVNREGLIFYLSGGWVVEWFISEDETTRIKLSG